MTAGTVTSTPATKAPLIPYPSYTASIHVHVHVHVHVQAVHTRVELFGLAHEAYAGASSNLGAALLAQVL